MRLTATIAVLYALATPLAAQGFKNPGTNPPTASGPIGGGVRLTPREWAALPTPGGYSFATGVQSFTSQYDASAWDANQAVGEPNVYPRYGDLPGAWAPASTESTQDVLVLTFDGQMTEEIWIFETFGVGGLYEVDDMSSGAPVPLWIGTAATAAGEARVLRITLPQSRPITALRLVVNPAAVGLFPEIDAVCIVPSLAGPQLAPVPMAPTKP